MKKTILFFLCNFYLFKNLFSEDLTNCKIDITSFISGVYIVKLSSDFRSDEIKFIKN